MHLGMAALGIRQGFATDYPDTDRSGDVARFDLLCFRQLINGVSPATRPWAGETMNSEQP